MEKIRIGDICTYRFPSKLNYSPDGSKAVMVIAQAREDKKGYDRDLYLLEGGALKRLTYSKDTGNYTFENNDSLLFVGARTDKEKERSKKEGVSFIYRLPLNGGEAYPVYEIPLPVHSVKVMGTDPKKLILEASMYIGCPKFHTLSKEERSSFIEALDKDRDYEDIRELRWWLNGAGMLNRERNALYIYDVETGTVTPVTEVTQDLGSYTVKGSSIIYSISNIDVQVSEKEEIWSYDVKTGDREKLVSDKYSVHALYAVDDTLFFAGSECRRYGLNENPKFFIYDFTQHTEKEICDPDICIGTTVLSDTKLGSYSFLRSYKGCLYFSTTVCYHDEIRCISRDGKMDTIYVSDGAIDDFDIKNGKILMISMKDQKLQEIYSVENGKETQLTHMNEKALEGRYVAKPKHIVIDSEGYAIDGWILKPYGYDEKETYPAILDIHGGPKCAYGEIFFHEMQLWASEGYFVFFANPYGGEGKGNEFAFMRDKYGTIDYRNLMEFTDKVLELYPQIDRKRLGVTGGSYGGYMTNWIVTQTDRFAAAATQRSISNWISMYGISDIGPSFTEDQNGGSFFTPEGLEKMWDHIPLKYVANVTTPLLFIHGDEDYRCPIAEGYQFYSAIIRNGGTARMYVFHGENHELSRGGKPLHRERRLKEITDWINRYCK